MANPEHLAILKQGENAWNIWRANNTEITPDLKCADLRALILSHYHCQNDESHWTTVNLSHADLRECHLGHSYLRFARLNHATLVGANLIGVNLAYDQLQGTDFRGAFLWEADFSGARAVAARFEGAQMGSTIFAGTLLKECTGLDTVQHLGPSRISVDTLGDFLRTGISERFLVGTGLSRDLISNVRGLLIKPISFYSCFISHSTLDQQFADRLHADLQSKGVRCWFAPHDIKGGKKIHEQIDDAIRLHDRLLLILSEASMSSEWVKTEIANARQREIREKRQMLFPISLVPYDRVQKWKAFDADTGKDSAREIREYFIPDFSNWTDPASYQQAFHQLLRDLRAETKNQGFNGDL